MNDHLITIISLRVPDDTSYIVHCVVVGNRITLPATSFQYQYTEVRKQQFSRYGICVQHTSNIDMYKHQMHFTVNVSPLIFQLQ